MIPLTIKQTNPVAMIFGVTGQDGSYLSELLLSKGYRVVGVKRRASVSTTERVDHLFDNSRFQVVEGDVTDPSSIMSLMTHYHPAECYNLAAQSHVKTSFEQPTTTFAINAVGVVNILEAIRVVSPSTKFYQASTSEMFGSNCTQGCTIEYNEVGAAMKAEREGTPYQGPHTDIGIKYQDEDTPLAPNSPYAVAKTAAHNMVSLYRKAYGLHASCGILFNHETLTYGTPLIFKDKDGYIDILPIGDIARFNTGVKFDLSNLTYQEGTPTTQLFVWDNNGWTKVKFVSGYPHKEQKNPRIINARNSVYSATGSHTCILEDDSEKETQALVVSDKVKLVKYPKTEQTTTISLEEAEFLGMLVGDGNLNKGNPRFANKDMILKQRFTYLWSVVSDGTSKYTKSKSGFTGKEIGQVTCVGKADIMLDIYTCDMSPFGHKNKKVPSDILNSSVDIMEAFLVGYNKCDGLKKNPCTYTFKNFKTNSATLASGLLFLISNVTGQKYNITVEESDKHGKQQFYYSLNLLSNNDSPLKKYHYVKQLLDVNISHRSIHKNTGISRSFIRKVSNGYIPSKTHHLEKPNNEVKKIIEIPNYDGWFFDLETESGTFHAGVGQGLVHNSPRRGEDFVTRKITKWIAEFSKWRNQEFKTIGLLGVDEENYIHYGLPTFGPRLFPKLRLGNLDAKRDWGHARDYIEGMWMMLQRDEPDDYILATGETHSIREFLDAAFQCIQIDNWEPYIVIDPKFYRPCEVEYLLGVTTKATEVLGWSPRTTFEELVIEMVEGDINGQTPKT